MGEISSFGNVHEVIRHFIEDGTFKFDGNYHNNTGDDLDPIVFKLLDMQPPKKWGKGIHCNEWICDADEMATKKDMRWLGSEHGIILLKAALIKRGIKELTWEKTKSSEPSQS